MNVLGRLSAALAASVMLFLVPLPPAQAATEWVDYAEHGDVAYFLYQNPQSIARYDLATRQHLPSLAIQHVGSRLHVDASGVYYITTKQVFRRAPEGTEYLLDTLAPYANTVDISSGDGYLFVTDTSDTVAVISESTGARTATYNNNWPLRGLSANAAVNKVFGRSVNLSPAGIYSLEYNDAGAITKKNLDPNSGGFPSASQTWIYSNGNWVVDDSGTVYATLDLQYVGSLGGPFTAPAFAGDTVFVARDRTIQRYDGTFKETGRFTLSSPVLGLGTTAGGVVAFSAGAEGPVATYASDASFQALPTAAAQDPAELQYAVDDAFLGMDGNVYLLNRSAQNVFVWSPATGAYLPAVTLAGSPLHVAYDPQRHQLYATYAGGMITRMALGGDRIERPFVNLPHSCLGLAMTDNFLFAADPSYSVTHYTYDMDGVRAARDMGHYSEEYIWNAANRRMYFLRDDSIPNDFIYQPVAVDGDLGMMGDTPEHTDEGKMHPIRVRADGALALLGSGRIYDAIGMTQVDALTTKVSDAVWAGNLVTSILAVGSDTRLTLWDANFNPNASFTILGAPVRLFMLDSASYVIVTSRFGRPRFSLFPDVDSDGDGHLDGQDDFPADPNEQVDNDRDGYGDNGGRPRGSGGPISSSGLLLLLLLTLRRVTSEGDPKLSL